MKLEALKAVLPDVIELTKLAGMRVLSIYQSYLSDAKGESLQLFDKSDGSPLTVADMISHETLVDGLRKLTPKIPVVSEEDSESLQYRKDAGCFWLLDPLDGTKEFISKNGEFTINVAFVIDGCAVWGAVYAPVLGAMYWGGSAFGAFRQVGGRQESLQIRGKRTQRICQVVASKSHLNDETKLFIGRLGAVELIQAGSSLKFCRVAEGVADVYPRLAPTAEWDTAAAQAILEGSGGCVVDLAGSALRYGKPDLLNPYFVATADLAWLPA